MNRHFFLLLLVFGGLLSLLTGDDRIWPLDSNPAEGLDFYGTIPTADGVRNRSLVFDGSSLITVSDSKTLASSERGFTLSLWVNPYRLSGDQQMIAAKNVYASNQRQWGVMIDNDNLFRLYVWQGRWKTVHHPTKPKPGHWHRIGVVMRPESAELWVNGSLTGTITLSHPVTTTAAPITFGGVDDGGHIRQNFTGAIDEVRLQDSPVSERAMRADFQPIPDVHRIPPSPELFTLWSGPAIPSDVTQIPFANGIEHRVIHRASAEGYKFLHGAAIVHHKGVMYANWANSPTHENGPHETLQGRRSKDNGVTWSQPEVIGPGFEGPERHSHGVLFVHGDEVWTIAARFGIGEAGKRFPGLQAEAFVLNRQGDRWESRGIVMTNCWPYDEPVRMPNGSFITGGQDKDGLPVVAVSRGSNLTTWDTVAIPYDPKLKPSFAETTVGLIGNQVLAVIRGGGGMAWVATSDDFGRTWSTARPSNLPMPRAKAYLGRLSNGQLYLLSNHINRDTLLVSVGEPHQNTLCRTYRIRHGKSVPPRFPGNAKSKQWSYPYGYEHDGHLYVVYSIGKEDCGLSVIPLESLTND